MKFRILSCVLCVLVVFSVFYGCSNKKPSAPVTDELVMVTQGEPDTQVDKGENVISTPDETGARLGSIQGFVQKNSLSSQSFPQAVGDGALAVVSVGEYTGAYIEDGTDIMVENVAAVIVQNISDKPIQHATLNLSTGEEKLYTFALSTLPVGRSALVLDTDKKLLAADTEITTFSADVKKCDVFETNSDKIKVTFENGVLKLTNLTDSDFRGVYVRYKNFTAGNVYFGGITYSASFDNVGAKGTYEYKAAHYYKDYSQIIMVQIVE